MRPIARKHLEEGRGAMVAGALRVSAPLLFCCLGCAQGSSDAPQDGVADGASAVPEAGGAAESAVTAESGAMESVDAGDPGTGDDGAIASDDGSVDDAPSTGASEDAGLPVDSAAADAHVADSAPASLSDGAPCGCSVQSVCTLGTCTPARRVFVTNETYAGSLGGHTGADATCQTLATTASLGGTWMAWISDATSSPSARFSQSTVGYYLLDGTLLSPNWADLTTTGLLHAIDVSETGVSLASASADASKTWTGTVLSGLLGSASCSDFSSSAGTETGEVGHCTGTGTTNWTSAYATEACNVQNHLYCFEQ